MDIKWTIISIAISIIVFLILREFFCWYLKINKRVSLLEDILEELKKMNGSDDKEKIETNKKEEVQEEDYEDDDEELDPDEPVEDPFWNKKN